MIFRKIRKEDYDAIRQLLMDEGWQHQVKDFSRFQKIMDKSGCSAVAIDGDTIIGFARAVQIDNSTGYISMVAVAHNKRNTAGQSISYLLFEHIREENPNIKWVLRRSMTLLRPDKSQTL